MNSTNDIAMRRFATATTLKREPTANARDADVIEVMTKVNRNMKNLLGSI